MNMNITINHIISFDSPALGVLNRLPVAGSPVAVTEQTTPNHVRGEPVAVMERLVAPPTRGRPRKTVETPPADALPPAEEKSEPAPAGDPGKIRQALRVIIDRGLAADLTDGRGTRRRDEIKAYLTTVAPECNGRLRDVPDEKLFDVDLDVVNAIVAS